MKAIYYQPAPVQLDVIGKPKDGCADLGRGKDILVKGVPIDESKCAGTCFLIDDEDPKAALKAAAKAARAEATRLAKLSVDADRSAKAALGKPNHAELSKAADEAAAAAESADEAADAAEQAAK